ncbi:hypothetical protein E6W39_21955 [Kitasatospora acidiphila]|uniref:DUF4129 domain-containing protein n=1 Tax=Kitasatospora acidiphila TaxID=2567942 RepID=A0A540W5U6_9ACTN|nr:hypothetical protein [Kitasatospora acidiphila]TQF04398.1 hypothetical protein E6W39_21955 [Kitasatospora acidiphila]
MTLPTQESPSLAPTTTAVTTTATATPSSLASAPASAATGAGALTSAVVSGAVLAAAITATINLWLARSRSREEERARLRRAFAEAFVAYTTYKELPYAIRRRHADQAADERVRLSEILREIQAQLAYHLAWTALESPAVGRAYKNLVQHLRRTAGTAMHDAWEAPAITTDRQMNVPPTVIDLSELAQYETAYLDAVHTHLHELLPWWKRLWRRRLLR